MTTTEDDSPDLQTAVSRYVAVARELNFRDGKALIEAVRSNFNPRATTLYDGDGEQCRNEDDLQAHGYTVEGAISREVHQLSFYSPRLEPANPASEAERREQVYHLPPESLLDALDSVTKPPALATFREQKFAMLLGQLQAQVEDEPLRPSTLPAEFVELLGHTDGLVGGGIPLATNGWYLVLPAHVQGREPTHIHVDKARLWTRSDGIEILTAWRFGGRVQNYDNYYIFCRDAGSTDAPQWRILIRGGGYSIIEIFSSMRAYIDSVTDQLRGDLSGPPLVNPWGDGPYPITPPFYL